METGQQHFKISSSSAAGIKAKKLLAGGLLFSLIFIPLFLLNDKLQSIYESRQKWNQSRIDEQLKEEISDFKEDFSPTVFLRKFIAKELPLENLANYFRIANSSADAENNGLQALHKKLEETLLNDKRRFKPLFFIVVNRDFSKFVSYFSDRFLKTPKSPIKELSGDFNDIALLQKYISFFAYEETLSQYGILQNHNLYESQRNFVRKHWNKKNLPQSRGFFFKGILSNFFKEAPFPGTIHSLFSDIFGFQNILFYFQPTYTNRKHSGSIIIAYLEDQFKAEQNFPEIVELAKDKRVKRFICSKSQKSTIPKDFASYSESIITNVADNKNRSLKLVAAIKPEENVKLKKAISIAGFLTKILLLLFFSLTIKVWIKKEDLAIPLRWKLFIIFLVAILMPASTGGILFYGIIVTEDSTNKNLAAAALESHLNHLELCKSEVESRQVLANLRLKLKITEALQTQAAADLKFSSHQNNMRSNIFNTFIYDTSGSKLNLQKLKRRNKIEQIKLSTAVSALNNISGLIANSITGKDLENMSFTEGFTENLRGFYGFKKAVGHEGENVPSPSNLSELSRSQFFLFPDLSMKNFKPKAIGFFELINDNPFQKWVKSNDDYPVSFFSGNTRLYSYEIALGNRDSRDLRINHWLNLSDRHNSNLSYIVRQAATNRSSGFSRDKNDDNISYSWRFYKTSPIIISGMSAFHKDNFNSFFLDLLPVVLICTILLSILLISDIVSIMLLSPIKSISEGVKEIARSGDFNLKVVINSCDELKLLGDSFNSMSRGLLHKKHISRFVSDRLISAISDENNSNNGENFIEQEMSILTSDIRSFTTISEENAPELVVEILNEYFTLMEECILAEGGVIEKFIGDAIIAVFSAENGENPGKRSCKAARKMKAMLGIFNETELIQQQTFKINNGIGIASGKALAATLGKGCSRQDFTIVGELVNKSEFLETLTKKGKYSQIFIDGATAKMLDNEIEMVNCHEELEIEAFEIV